MDMVFSLRRASLVLVLAAILGGETALAGDHGVAGDCSLTALRVSGVIVGALNPKGDLITEIYSHVGMADDIASQPALACPKQDDEAPTYEAPTRRVMATSRFNGERR